LVDRRYDGAVGSTGFFVLRPSVVQGEYLLALAKSLLVREQMRCESTGTILAAVPRRSISKVIVPCIPAEKREAIVQLVQRAHHAQREARDLMKTGSQAIEMAIEEGEDSAIEFLSSGCQAPVG